MLVTELSALEITTFGPAGALLGVLTFEVESAAQSPAGDADAISACACVLRGDVEDVERVPLAAEVATGCVLVRLSGGLEIVGDGVLNEGACVGRRGPVSGGRLAAEEEKEPAEVLVGVACAASNKVGNDVSTVESGCHDDVEWSALDAAAAAA